MDNVDVELSRTARYRLRKESVAWQNVAPEAILVQLDREELHVANPTAALLIDALQEGATLPELVTRVTDDYEVEAAQATADVESFLRQALAAGLLTEEK
ncbi:MAG TPA: PqqD family protein [Polyangiaceae bacterium]